jgi:hypothetical protein
MPTYADILRDQAGNHQQPHGSAVSGEPAGIANDPELQAARELLLRRMHGVSWVEETLGQKLAYAFHLLFRWSTAPPVERPSTVCCSGSRTES